jgi:translation initiation factor 1
VESSANQRRIVYASGIGRVRYCRTCGQPETSCVCASRKQTGASVAPNDGFVRVAFERKGRRGKPVTLLTGLPPDADTLAELARALKQLCGTGGTVENGVILLQGDQRDKAQARLTQLGYKLTLRTG